MAKEQPMFTVTVSSKRRQRTDSLISQKISKAIEKDVKFAKFEIRIQICYKLIIP